MKNESLKLIEMMKQLRDSLTASQQFQFNELFSQLGEVQAAAHNDGWNDGWNEAASAFKAAVTNALEEVSK